MLGNDVVLTVAKFSIRGGRGGAAFERLFLEKTKNHWHDRANFVKRPAAFNLVDIDYGGDDLDLGGGDAIPTTPTAKSTLHPAIQQLVRRLFNVDTIKQVRRQPVARPPGRARLTNAWSACTVR